MTTLIERPATASPGYFDDHLAVNPQAIIDARQGQCSVMDVAQVYHSVGERPIPLCDAKHAFVEAWHRDRCKSPGKALLERDYPRFAAITPTPIDIVRMFGPHQGNIGGVVPGGRIVIDVDPRSGGLESLVALTGSYGSFPETPTVLTGGNGVHNYFLLPPGVTVPSGGSLAALGFPGIEWKGAGAQLVLPPSVHISGQAYRWDPGYGLGEVPIAPVPDSLIQLILEQSGSSDHRSDRYVNLDVYPGAVNYAVQPARVQRHFAGLWAKAGVEVQPGSGDQFYSCPFHVELHPSMHIDGLRCIWYCFSSECAGHGGGGVRELEALAGPLEQGPLPSGLVFHAPPECGADDASELGSSPYPNPDAVDADPYLQELKTRARELFPLPKGQQPKVISRLCAFTEDPSRLIRH